MKKISVFIWMLMLAVGSMSDSFAYESVSFSNGGTIQGSVEFSGAIIPKDKTFSISSDVKYCGKEKRTEKYLINAERRIKNVIVFLTDIKAGKSVPAETVSVVDSKCTFIPHVMIGFKGSQLVVKNEDPVLHTGHIYSHIKGKTIFNVALPEKGSTVTKSLTKTGLLELNCDCHPWMESFVYIFDHPYVAITDENGTFVISDIPPGVYTVEAWHETLGTVMLQNVTVQSGKTSTIHLQYTGK